MIIVRKIEPTLVPLNGTSIWSDTRGLVARVTEIKFEYTENDPYVLIWVKHDLPWDIYTDRGFESSVANIISRMVKVPVRITFTEQGMQANHIASMEAGSKTSEKKLIKWMKSQK